MPVQGTWAWSLIQGDPMCHGAVKPGSWNYQSPGPRACALKQEKPLQWEAQDERFPPAGLFSFHYRDIIEKAERSQRNTQRAEMMVVALSTKRPPEGRWVFAGQAGHGGPQGPQVPRPTQGAPCEQKGTGGEMVVDSPIYGQPERWRRECPRHLRSMGGNQFWLFIEHLELNEHLVENFSVLEWNGAFRKRCQG